MALLFLSSRSTFAPTQPNFLVAASSRAPPPIPRQSPQHVSPSAGSGDPLRGSCRSSESLNIAHASLDTVLVKCLSCPPGHHTRSGLCALCNRATQLKAAHPYSRKPPLPAACPLGSLPPKLAVAWDLSLPCPATDHRHIGPSHLDAYTANDSETTDRATKLIHTGKRDV